MQNQLSDKLKDLAVSSQKLIVDSNLFVNVRITPPEAPATREPVSIICVLDISGSMDTEATQGGNIESDGFSRLDLVKHSVNTIINSLSENDVLGIVSFSDNARVELNPTEMTEQNRADATAKVLAMRTQGSTNLWDGIRQGLELTKHQKSVSRNTFVVVLSDGEPNTRPKQGQVEATRKYIKENPMTASLSMFGYGYNLDTELLSNLCQIGGGLFGYIPDCSMIGTIFINFLSTALASYSPKLQAVISPKDCEIVSVNGIRGTNKADLGAILYGEPRNLLIEFKGVPQNEDVAELQLFLVEWGRDNISVQLNKKQEGNADNVRAQLIRNRHINALGQCIGLAKQNNLGQCREEVAVHLQYIKKIHDAILDENSSKFVSTIIRDIESTNANQGQISIALSSAQFWKKWGIHYFYALKIAHAKETCTNFKDPGLQLYGSELFRTLQGTMDTIFINLAPPTPSIKKYDANGNVKVVNNMGNYYDYNGGCIYGQCDVKMADGSIKKIQDLSVGEQVVTLAGTSKIRCIIKTEINDSIDMVQSPQGLVITKYHPVNIKGQWVFPIDWATVVNMHIDAYYNFVLEGGHSMIVNGVACVTLGHGFQDNDVIKHGYFGTEMVIEDLKRIRGWNSGLIVMQKQPFARDPVTHQVIGLVY